MTDTDRQGAGWSLRLRVLLAGAVVVALFAGLTGLAAERAFRDSVEEMSRERLQARIYMLMGAVEIADDGTLDVPAALPEPQLAVPGSGSYAAISIAGQDIVWQSDSSLGVDVPYNDAAYPGDFELNTAAAGAQGLLQVLAYPVFWELASGEEQVIVFKAAESRRQFSQFLVGAGERSQGETSSNRERCSSS